MQCFLNCNRVFTHAMDHAQFLKPTRYGLWTLVLFGPSIWLDLCALVVSYSSLQKKDDWINMWGSCLFLCYTFFCILFVKHLFYGSCCARFLTFLGAHLALNISGICLLNLSTPSNSKVASYILHTLSIWWVVILFFLFLVEFAKGNTTYLHQIHETASLRQPLLPNYQTYEDSFYDFSEYEVTEWIKVLSQILPHDLTYIIVSYLDSQIISSIKVDIQPDGRPSLMVASTKLDYTLDLKHSFTKQETHSLSVNQLERETSKAHLRNIKLSTSNFGCIWKCMSCLHFFYSCSRINEGN